MPISEIVTALIDERDRLNAAIELLQSHDGHSGTVTHRSRRRKPMSLATRKALSAKLRAAWARRKKAAAVAKNA